VTHLVLIIAVISFLFLENLARVILVRVIKSEGQVRMAQLASQQMVLP